jgi:hypothetical protein
MPNSIGSSVITNNEKNMVACQPVVTAIFHGN